MAAELVVYFLYSRSHSRLAAPRVGARRERNISGGETA
jgi:hypothetical protein